ncbi:MAG: sulfite exporter TauE/SafE family protein [Acidimicrobiia bacterium]
MRGLLASPLGFLIGVSLGALGGGGSILAVPVLVYAAGQSPKAATATSLLLVGTAALVGMGAHSRAGRVHFRTGVVFGLAGIGGSLAGTALNERLDPDVLLLGFSMLILVAAWRMLTGCPTCTQVGEQLAIEGTGGPTTDTRVAVARRVGSRLTVRTALMILAAGTVVGFLTGLFGVGGGFVIVPALTLLLGMSMPDAIGTSLLVIAINSAVGLLARIGSSTIDWSVAAPFTIAAILGVLTGKRIADRLDAKRSLRWFATLLVVIAVFTAAQAALALWG